MVPDLASDAQTATAQAAAGAGSADGVAAATGDFSGGPQLGGLLLGQDSRIFVLGTVAPDGGFLLAHEGDVAGGVDGLSRAGGGCTTERIRYGG